MQNQVYKKSSDGGDIVLAAWKITMRKLLQLQKSCPDSYMQETVTYVLCLTRMVILSYKYATYFEGRSCMRWFQQGDGHLYLSTERSEDELVHWY